ncbi:hypothetical protein ACNKHN_00330 [Shigella flexneri]
MKRITLVWQPKMRRACEDQAIEQLAEHVPGVLLLTATPATTGDGKPLLPVLRLLDPQPFPMISFFLKKRKKTTADRDVAMPAGR